MAIRSLTTVQLAPLPSCVQSAAALIGLPPGLGPVRGSKARRKYTSRSTGFFPRGILSLKRAFPPVKGSHRPRPGRTPRTGIRIRDRRELVAPDGPFFVPPAVLACAARIRKTAVGHGPKAADYQGPQIPCLEGVEFNPEQLGTGSGSAGSAIVPTAGVGSGRGSAVIPAAWTAADNRQDATAGWMPMQRAGARCDRRAAQTAWAYNVAVPGLCGSSWFNLAGSASGTTLTIPVAGNYTVTCLASPPAMGGGVPVQVSVTFGVPAPTSLRGLSGTNVPTFPNSAVLACRW